MYYKQRGMLCEKGAWSTRALSLLLPTMALPEQLGACTRPSELAAKGQAKALRLPKAPPQHNQPEGFHTTLSYHQRRPTDSHQWGAEEECDDTGFLPF